MRRAVVASACCSTVLAIAVSPTGAFGFGSPTGGAGGAGGGGSSTPTSGHAAFFDAHRNVPSDCTGIGGTVGGSFGTARWRIGPPSTVVINVSHLTPNASYTVVSDDSSCVEHPVGTLSTDARGKATGSFTFFASTRGAFIVYNNTSEFETPEITF